MSDTFSGATPAAGSFSGATPPPGPFFATTPAADAFSVPTSPVPGALGAVPPPPPAVVPPAPPVATPPPAPPLNLNPLVAQPLAGPPIPGTEFSGPVAYPATYPPSPAMPPSPVMPPSPAMPPAPPQPGAPWAPRPGMPPVPAAPKPPKAPVDLTGLLKYLDFGIAGAALLTLVFAFFGSYYVISGFGMSGGAGSAWASWLSTLGVLLVVLGGAVVALLGWGAIVEARRPILKLGSLGGLGLGWILILISLFVVPGFANLASFITHIGRGVGFWLVFVFATLAAGGAVFDFISSRPKAPKPALAAAPGMAMPQAYGAVPPAAQTWAPQPPVAPQPQMGLPPVVPPPMPGVPPAPPQSGYLPPMQP